MVSGLKNTRLSGAYVDSNEEDGADEETEAGEERCFDDLLGDYVDCPKEDSEEKEEDLEDEDAISFPLFEVPLITREMETALSSPDGELFRDIWKRLFDSPDTVPLNIGENNLKKVTSVKHIRFVERDEHLL